MKTAFIFPGQGAQVVGMGADIVKTYSQAQELFSKAGEILGYDLSQLCFEGPDEQLNSTEISQPAIFTTSAAILEVLKTELPGLVADVTAGLSLGEYTALYAAGIFSFEDALVLVQKRGRAMQAAADETEGSMVSIIGLDAQKVHQLCDAVLAGSDEDEDDESEGSDIEEFLEPVNFNCPGQIVVSGTKPACRRAKELAPKFGAIKAVRLDVAGAFHTQMMTSAADALRKALSDCHIAEPSQVKVIANINAEYYSTSEGIADGLISQLTQPIRWQKCMERLLGDGIENFYEIGPSRVLTGLMKRINRKIKVVNISSAQTLQEALKL